MSDQQKAVYLRFNGWIDHMSVASVEPSGVIHTARNKRGIEATCWPDNRADVQMWDGDRLVFDGLGVWSHNEIVMQTGTEITIKRGKSIWNVDDSRWRVLDRTIVVRAELNGSAEYEFKMEGKTWAIDIYEV